MGQKIVHKIPYLRYIFAEVYMGNFLLNLFIDEDISHLKSSPVSFNS